MFASVHREQMNKNCSIPERTPLRQLVSFQRNTMAERALALDPNPMNTNKAIITPRRSRSIAVRKPTPKSLPRIVGTTLKKPIIYQKRMSDGAVVTPTAIKRLENTLNKALINLTSNPESKLPKHFTKNNSKDLDTKTTISEGKPTSSVVPNIVLDKPSPEISGESAADIEKQPKPKITSVLSPHMTIDINLTITPGRRGSFRRSRSPRIGALMRRKSFAKLSSSKCFPDNVISFSVTPSLNGKTSSKVVALNCKPSKLLASYNKEEEDEDCEEWTDCVQFDGKNTDLKSLIKESTVKPIPKSKSSVVSKIDLTENCEKLNMAGSAAPPAITSTATILDKCADGPDFDMALPHPCNEASAITKLETDSSGISSDEGVVPKLQGKATPIILISSDSAELQHSSGCGCDVCYPETLKVPIFEEEISKSSEICESNPDFSFLKEASSVKEINEPLVDTGAKTVENNTTCIENSTSIKMNATKSAAQNDKEQRLEGKLQEDNSKIETYPLQQAKINEKVTIVEELSVKIDLVQSKTVNPVEDGSKTYNSKIKSSAKLPTSSEETQFADISAETLKSNISDETLTSAIFAETETFMPPDSTKDKVMTTKETIQSNPFAEKDAIQVSENSSIWNVCLKPIELFSYATETIFNFTEGTDGNTDLSKTSADLLSDPVLMNEGNIADGEIMPGITGSIADIIKDSNLEEVKRNCTCSACWSDDTTIRITAKKASQNASNMKITFDGRIPFINSVKENSENVPLLKYGPRTDFNSLNPLDTLQEVVENPDKSRETNNIPAPSQRLPFELVATEIGRKEITRVCSLVKELRPKEADKMFALLKFDKNIPEQLLHSKNTRVKLPVVLEKLTAIQADEFSSLQKVGKNIAGKPADFKITPVKLLIVLEELSRTESEVSVPHYVEKYIPGQLVNSRNTPVNLPTELKELPRVDTSETIVAQKVEKYFPRQLVDSKNTPVILPLDLNKLTTIKTGKISAVQNLETPNLGLVNSRNSLVKITTLGMRTADLYESSRHFIFSTENNKNWLNPALTSSISAVKYSTANLSPSRDSFDSIYVGIIALQNNGLRKDNFFNRAKPDSVLFIDIQTVGSHLKPKRPFLCAIDSFSSSSSIAPRSIPVFQRPFKQALITSSSSGTIKLDSVFTSGLSRHNQADLDFNHDASSTGYFKDLFYRQFCKNYQRKIGKRACISIEVGLLLNICAVLKHHGELYVIDTSGETMELASQSHFSTLYSKSVGMYRKHYFPSSNISKTLSLLLKHQKIQLEAVVVHFITTHGTSSINDKFESSMVGVKTLENRFQQEKIPDSCTIIFKPDPNLVKFSFQASKSKENGIILPIDKASTIAANRFTEAMKNWENLELICDPYGIILSATDGSKQFGILSKTFVTIRDTTGLISVFKSEKFQNLVLKQENRTVRAIDTSMKTTAHQKTFSYIKNATRDLQLLTHIDSCAMTSSIFDLKLEKPPSSSNNINGITSRHGAFVFTQKLNSGDAIVANIPRRLLIISRRKKLRSKLYKRRNSSSIVSSNEQPSSEPSRPAKKKVTFSIDSLEEYFIIPGRHTTKSSRNSKMTKVLDKVFSTIGMMERSRIHPEDSSVLTDPKNKINISLEFSDHRKRQNPDNCVFLDNHRALVSRVSAERPKIQNKANIGQTIATNVALLSIADLMKPDNIDSNSSNIPVVEVRQSTDKLMNTSTSGSKPPTACTIMTTKTNSISTVSIGSSNSVLINKIDPKSNAIVPYTAMTEKANQASIVSEGSSKCVPAKQSALGSTALAASTAMSKIVNQALTVSEESLKSKGSNITPLNRTAVQKNYQEEKSASVNNDSPSRAKSSTPGANLKKDTTYSTAGPSTYMIGGKGTANELNSDIDSGRNKKEVNSQKINTVTSKVKSSDGLSNKGNKTKDIKEPKKKSSNSSGFFGFITPVVNTIKGLFGSSTNETKLKDKLEKSRKINNAHEEAKLRSKSSVIFTNSTIKNSNNKLTLKGNGNSNPRKPQAGTQKSLIDEVSMEKTTSSAILIEKINSKQSETVPKSQSKASKDKPALSTILDQIKKTAGLRNCNEASATASVQNKEADTAAPANKEAAKTSETPVLPTKLSKQSINNSKGAGWSNNLSTEAGSSNTLSNEAGSATACSATNAMCKIVEMVTFAPVLSTDNKAKEEVRPSPGKKIENHNTNVQIGHMKPPIPTPRQKHSSKLTNTYTKVLNKPTERLYKPEDTAHSIPNFPYGIGDVEQKTSYVCQPSLDNVSNKDVRSSEMFELKKEHEIQASKTTTDGKNLLMPDPEECLTKVPDVYTKLTLQSTKAVKNMEDMPQNYSITQHPSKINNSVKSRSCPPGYHDPNPVTSAPKDSQKVTSMKAPSHKVTSPSNKSQNKGMNTNCLNKSILSACPNEHKEKSVDASEEKSIGAVSLFSTNDLIVYSLETTIAAPVKTRPKLYAKDLKQQRLETSREYAVEARPQVHSNELSQHLQQVCIQNATKTSPQALSDRLKEHPVEAFVNSLLDKHGEDTQQNIQLTMKTREPSIKSYTIDEGFVSDQNSLRPSIISSASNDNINTLEMALTGSKYKPHSLDLSIKQAESTSQPNSSANQTAKDLQSELPPKRSIKIQHPTTQNRLVL